MLSLVITIPTISCLAVSDVTAAGSPLTDLFTGNMSYRPNVESARFLVEEVMPLLWKEFPDLKLCLAGANPSASVVGMKSERVEVTGWVEDIHEVYVSAKVFVAQGRHSLLVACANSPSTPAD